MAINFMIWKGEQKWRSLFQTWLSLISSHIKEYGLNKFLSYLYIYIPVVSNYRYLKLNFLVPENLL